MAELVIPKQWKEILYFHQHPEEHPDSDYVCDSEEESEIVLWAHSLEAENAVLRLGQHKSWVTLLGENAELATENKELRAQIERYEKPVSPVEFATYFRNSPQALRHGVTALIASRKAAENG